MDQKLKRNSLKLRRGTWKAVLKNAVQACVKLTLTFKTSKRSVLWTCKESQLAIKYSTSSLKRSFYKTLRRNRKYTGRIYLTEYLLCPSQSKSLYSGMIYIEHSILQWLTSLNPKRPSKT
jgi:hypothetical protein